MKVDLHVHTRESSSAPHHWLGEFLGVHECYTQAEEALDAALGRGMDAIAITNHDAAQDAIRMSEARPDRVIAGCEYTVYAGRGRYVHVVVLGIGPTSHERLLRERRRGLGRFTGLARSEGLPFFLAHPAWEVNVDKGGPTAYVSKAAALCDWAEHFDILETMNGNCPAENVLAQGLARYFRKAAAGGSDAHSAAAAGSAWTEAEAGASTVEEFMECMRAGRIRPGGSASDSVGFARMMRELLGVFYRRELLRAVSSGSLAGYLEKTTGSDLVRAAVELALLPGFFWMPQAGSKTYFEDLARRAERLRHGLIDFLTHRLARSVARGDLGAEERARRWIGGMREIYAAFPFGERILPTREED